MLSVGGIHTWAGISHRQEEWLLVLLWESLVLKLGSVDGLATSTVTVSEVTTLDHELLNDPMKDGTLVVKRLSFLSYALLTSAEASEVLGSLWHEIRVQLHDNPTSRPAADLDVEEDPRALGIPVLSHLCISTMLDSSQTNVV